jgi:hypothetical protein
MSAIQILLVALAVLALSRVALRFRRGGMPLVHFGLWFLFWSAVIVVAVRPGTTSALASVLGVGRGADVVIYLALVLLFYLVFRLFGRIEELERQITRVVRAAALKELDAQIGPPPPGPPPPPS